MSENTSIEYESECIILYYLIIFATIVLIVIKIWDIVKFLLKSILLLKDNEFSSKYFLNFYYF